MWYQNRYHSGKQVANPQSSLLGCELNRWRINKILYWVANQQVANQQLSNLQVSNRQSTKYNNSKFFVTWLFYSLQGFDVNDKDAFKKLEELEKTLKIERELKQRMSDRSARAFFKQFGKMVEECDVIIQVTLCYFFPPKLNCR